jgi:hypothetical protein
MTAWNGTQTEYLDLVRALIHNCACEFANGVLLSACPAHRMLAEDQRALNGLVFGRRIAGRLQHEEWLKAA